MTRRLRVLLVTSWDEACGIAEHSAMLKEAVEAADPAIEIFASAKCLDPNRVHEAPPYDLLHLNYQAGLHSRWTSEVIRARRAAGPRVVVTYHDTGVPNSDQCKAVVGACDVAIVHEPYDDLPRTTRYWRMGVETTHTPTTAWRHLTKGQRPVVGTIGFPFPWKCYDELMRTAGAAGWGVLLLAPGATPAQVETWKTLNPQCLVRTDFVPRHEAIQWLAGCEATAFTYVCHNTGQSGAILLGVAARKPVVALSTCRQFRALHEDGLGRLAIDWCETFEEVGARLRTLPRDEGLDPQMVALAEQESWARLGARYAALYRELAT